MSDTHENNSNHQAVPFFARYLEGQINEEIEELSDAEMEALGGGGRRITTEKYPSDNDEPNRGGRRRPTTRKYPSDSDERDRTPVTRKYPSDSDEPNSGGGSGAIVTYKYPSDNDEPNSR